MEVEDAEWPDGGKDDDHHRSIMRYALRLAKKSPPRPTNFRVGAVLVDLGTRRLVSSGFTLELPGNTHAEEVCLAKLADRHGVEPTTLRSVVTEPHALYTTVEPCGERLSGKRACVERVLEQSSWIRQVFYGFREPDVFVEGNNGLERLRAEGGIEVRRVEGLEAEIQEVATAGHKTMQ